MTAPGMWIIALNGEPVHTTDDPERAWMLFRNYEKIQAVRSRTTGWVGSLTLTDPTGTPRRRGYYPRWPGSPQA